jgi:biopolymer transport protein ExbD
MAMNVGDGSGEGEVMVEMNTTPLIDVMLVLLVMLIVTLPIQTHAVKLDMPPPSPPPPVQPQTININVDFDGTIEWNSNPVSFATLDGYLYQEGQKELGAQSEIHITADRLAKYDTVAKVMADAQRRGITKMGIVNTNTYVQ